MIWVGERTIMWNFSNHGWKWTRIKEKRGRKNIPVKVGMDIDTWLAVWTTAVFVVNPANLKNSLVYRTIHALFVFDKFIITFEVRYIFPLKSISARLRTATTWKLWFRRTTTGLFLPFLTIQQRLKFANFLLLTF